MNIIELYKDLSFRQPFDVKCKVNGSIYTYILKSIYNDNNNIYCELQNIDDESTDVYPIENVKPLLRPISSMTREESLELKQTYIFPFNNEDCEILVWTIKSIDWLNAHYFDYRYLINNGLAIAI